MLGVEDHAVVEESCVGAQEGHLLRTGFDNSWMAVSN